MQPGDENSPDYPMRDNPLIAPIDDTSAQTAGSAGPEDVVEIGLLLPVSWADALLALSKRRGQSVGQVLRTMIDRGLMDDLLTDP